MQFPQMKTKGKSKKTLAASLCVNIPRKHLSNSQHLSVNLTHLENTSEIDTNAAVSSIYIYTCKYHEIKTNGIYFFLTFIFCLGFFSLLVHEDLQTHSKCKPLGVHCHTVSNTAGWGKLTPMWTVRTFWTGIYLFSTLTDPGSCMPSVHQCNSKRNAVGLIYWCASGWCALTCRFVYDNTVQKITR